MGCRLSTRALPGPNQKEQASRAFYGRSSSASLQASSPSSSLPGPNEPSGFILTTILGIVGAFVATYLGQALHWYGPGQGAGLIGAVVGAVIVLLVYGMITGRRTAV
jgi:uncharacterized membrane protein YeaQ/YmgE (transglycosylase-associated protein family)